MKLLAYLVGHLLLVCAGAVFAQAPDVILVNGKVVTADERGTIHQALAVREGRIVALGSTAKIKALAGKQTRTVELAGRTVIPGLIDSHMHAIRAALSYSTQVHWFCAASCRSSTSCRRRASSRRWRARASSSTSSTAWASPASSTRAASTCRPRNTRRFSASGATRR